MPAPVEGATGTDRSNGRPVVYRGGQWVYADSVGKLTEDQGKAQTHGRLMANAEKSYQEAVGGGYDPTTPRNSLAAFLEGLPFGGLDGAGAFIRDNVSDRGRQAELMWSDAQLKAMSGAAAPEAEVKRNIKTYFTRPGQAMLSQGPQTGEARREAYESAKVRAGPASSAMRPYPGDRANPVRILRKSQYDALAPGSWFVDVDGAVVQKRGRR